jgi:RNA polymerase sigma factor (TIGR02999 family)
MPNPSPPSAGHLLQQLAAGDRSAFDRLVPLVYDELHRIARRRRRQWQGQDTLDTTALLHEAYLKLADGSSPGWQNRAHFLGVASNAMRQVLIDHARRRSTAKRGGERVHVPLHLVEEALRQAEPPSGVADDLLVALEDALRRLGRWNHRQMRIVECRFFAAMSIEETAEALGTSPATVKRGWRMAQAWLYRDLKRAAGEDR